MRSSRFAKSGLGIPYALFLLLFVVAPLFVLLYYAFTNGQGQFTVQNLAAFFTSPNTIGTLAYSFALAVVTTCVCVLLAYPIAYILARSNMRHKSVILVAFDADVDQFHIAYHCIKRDTYGVRGKSCPASVFKFCHRYDV